MVRKYLEKNNIEFTYIDLTQQREWISKVVEKSGQTGVPQIWIDDKVIVGFNVPEINVALSL
jgi:glutaredoxin